MKGTSEIFLCLTHFEDTIPVKYIMHKTCNKYTLKRIVYMHFNSSPVNGCKILSETLRIKFKVLLLWYTNASILFIKR